MINLDPANENVSYECGIDVRDLITVDDAMAELHLGPNGAMLYCSDFLLSNFTWLQDQIIKKELDHPGTKYFVFDLPG